MSLIVDFLLLAASGTACFYCWVLSNRLKALTSTKDGIQTGIAALSRSVEEMQGAMSKTKDAANESALHLEMLIAQTEKKIPEVQELLRQIDEITLKAVDDTEAAARNLVSVLSPHIEEAKASAKLLLNALEDAAADACALQAKAETAKTPREDRGKIGEDDSDVAFAPEEQAA